VKKTCKTVDLRETGEVLTNRGLEFRGVSGPWLGGFNGESEAGPTVGNRTPLARGRSPRGAPAVGMVTGRGAGVFGYGGEVMVHYAREPTAWEPAVRGFRTVPTRPVTLPRYADVPTGRYKVWVTGAGPSTDEDGGVIACGNAGGY
jgi:hypothetical protein